MVNTPHKQNDFIVPDVAKYGPINTIKVSISNYRLSNLMLSMLFKKHVLKRSLRISLTFKTKIKMLIALFRLEQSIIAQTNTS